MNEKKWDEDKIETLLKDMPNIEDHRPKSEILARLKADERFTAPRRQNRLKKWIPAMVAAAALLLIGILVPSMLNDSERLASRDSTSQDYAETAALEAESNDAQLYSSQATDDGYLKGTEESVAVETENKLVAFAERSRTLKNAVYPQDLEGMTVFHLGLLGDQALSIPVTILIPKSQIEKDFGNVNPTSYELYEKYAAEIDETGLGFGEYHPYKGQLLAEGDALIHKLPQGHGYDSSSAAIETYTHSLQDTFYGFQEVRFQNEDGTPAEFDQVGEPGALPLTNGRNATSYYVYEQANGEQFLSPNFGQTYANLPEALEQIKEQPNDLFLSVIPEHIEFNVIPKADVTVVKFKQLVDLETMEQKRAMQMIEGLLLTGASFGEQLQFENIMQEEWNGFDFRKPLPVPVGSNPMPTLLK
ncbi:hypothetical protein [Sporosarcina sp. HYO08]|uniref:hypothetical protein n=1 Tax=Sporosarcina sp. HYO08 TaxID=1759557 RepID=UPI00079871BF|nr:hypothetical protein [Sporosarcina sp. HYO08]KXH82047.1 hypothetical protein AU377_07285 [Sporosarcina sp. HYO08]